MAAYCAPTSRGISIRGLSIGNTLSPLSTLQISALHRHCSFSARLSTPPTPVGIMDTMQELFVTIFVVTNVPEL